ncbi:MAG: RNA polymerase sigma factor region1.1 domain-containing protein, partial [Planctomycetota bacterium]
MAKTSSTKKRTRNSKAAKGEAARLQPDLGPAMRDLIAEGEEKGYLTYEELNDALPDETVEVDEIDEILVVLDQRGIEIVDEAEAKRRDAERDREDEDGPS